MLSVLPLFWPLKEGYIHPQNVINMIQVKNKETLKRISEELSPVVLRKLSGMKNDPDIPWLFPSPCSLPENFAGRKYSAGNAFLLLLSVQENKYRTPIFITKDQIENEKLKITDNNPVPVFHYINNMFNKLTGDSVTMENFQLLSAEQKRGMTSMPTSSVFMCIIWIRPT